METVAHRALEGKQQVSLSELDINRLPDEIIDTDILQLQKYIDKAAWKHLLLNSMFKLNTPQNTLYFSKINSLFCHVQYMQNEASGLAVPVQQ